MPAEFPASEPGVLFLRSFDDDRRKVSLVNSFFLLFAPPLFLKSVLHERDEQQLRKVFARFGNFYCIGCPTDRLIPVGANRIYLSGNDDWE